MRRQHGETPQDEIKLHWLLVGEILTWIGASFIWPLTSVYLHQRLHISLSLIGLVLFCNSLATVLGSFLAGRAYDRFNPYGLIVAGGLADASVLYLMAFDHAWPAYWFWLILTGFCGGWNSALINAIATSLKSRPGRYVFNMVYFAQNIGVVAGTLLVGYLYDFSITWLFVIAASLYVLVSVNALINYRPISRFHHARQGRQAQAHATVILPKANLALILGFFITLAISWLMYLNWESNLSVYMVSLGIAFRKYSLLWTLNALIILLMQVLLSKFPGLFKTLFHQIVFGISMLSLSFVTLIFAHDYAHFVFSMVVLTLGEATAFPAIPAYVNDLSPNQVKGKYQGLTLSAAAVGRALGPLFGGFLIDQLGYRPLFIIAAVMIFATLGILVPLHRQLKARLTLYK